MLKEGLSLVDIASIVLLETKEPMNLYDLFETVIKRKEIQVGDTTDLLTSFYADLTVSAKFVYTGENMWDLKSNQKIELWEKDGSFFKEYTEIDIPEEYLEEDKPKPVKAKAKPVKATPVVEEETVVEVAPVVEEEIVAKVAPVVEKPKASEVVDAVKEYEEATSEEFDEELFDDFDEEKYNEYMDTYEDQYDK
jgi:DNA-directed RNA polymerase subunit delta